MLRQTNWKAMFSAASLQRESVYRVFNLQLAAGRQTKQRSLHTVAPSRDIGCKVAPIIVKMLHSNANLVERQLLASKDRNHCPRELSMQC
jgi:hypothetical protein